MLVPRNCSVVARPNDLAGFDRLFDDLFSGFQASGLGYSRSFPAIDSWEDEKSYHLAVELPGFSKKDVEVSLLGKELEISGSREEESDDGATYHRRERYSGRFHRKFRFPVDVDSGKVEARFENGVLTLTVPKAEAALPRKIEVKG
jgi:HSP20 family protein